MSHSGRANATEAVALALAGGKTVTDAAVDGGVSRPTVTRWLRQAGFQARVTALRDAMVDRAVGSLADVACAAVATLDEERRQGERSGDRITAARAILANLIALRSASELEQRIEALEAMLSQQAEEAPRRIA